MIGKKLKKALIKSKFTTKIIVKNVECSKNIWRHIDMVKQRFADGDLWVDIDVDLCTGAGECVDVCPEDCYAIVDKKVNANNIGACIECAACDGVCPNDAILDQNSW